MSRNRLPIRDESLRLPCPPAPPIAPGSFVPCPEGGLSASQQWLYQWAFEQAQQAARPSLPERDLAGVWN